MVDTYIRAPGRVNLIGDHTDYQDGFCVPVAIDRDVLVGFRSRTDGMVVVQSREFDGAVDLAADGSATPHTVEPAWGRTVAAVLRVLATSGRPPVGFDAVIGSTIPVGSGLSSSAAFAVAVTLAAAHVAEIRLERRDLILAAQEAEHLASGVPCGVLDQTASVCGQAEHALLLDCRSIDIDAVPLPDAITILIVHSGLPRHLADSAYADRRATCEAAAARLGVPALRDATLEQVGDDPFARHVVTENARALAFATALRAGDVAGCGELMRASHASLRDDFEVSTPELDRLVELAHDEGAYGARLTGAGFGGCIVALVPAPRAETIAAAVADRYRAATGLAPTAFTVAAVDGAGLV